MSSIRAVIEQASSSINSDSALLDAEILIAHVLKKDRSYLFAWPEHELAQDQLQAIEALVKRRREGTPIAYLTGTQEFWSLDLNVNSNTLIPRPDTELLVERALSLIPPRKSLRIADLGTGSGAIALAIASERPDCEIVASDSRREALNVARTNAADLNISNVQFILSNWLDSIEGSFDLIVSNPPYIAEGDSHLTQGDVAFEPASALSAGPQGLDDIVTIAEQCRPQLNGALILEHGYDQQASVCELLRELGYQNIQGWKDLSKVDRCVTANWNTPDE